MSKKNISLILIYSIFLIALCLVFFLIPFPKSPTAWLEFAFSVVSICGGCAVSCYSFYKNGLKSKIYGFPIFKVGFIYTAAQLAFGFLLTLISCFVNVPIWISLIISLAIIAVSAIGFIGADNARDIITNQEVKEYEAVKTMKTFKLDIDYIVDSCKDENVKTELKKLSEKFRYSDPVSCDALTEIEDKIKSELIRLAAVVNANKEDAISEIENITILLADRNRRCKEFKHV